MFNVYDPLEEYEEGQEYEISDGIPESFLTDLELEEITEIRPPRLGEQASLMITSVEIEEPLSEPQPVKISPLDDAGEELTF